VLLKFQGEKEITSAQDDEAVKWIAGQLFAGQAPRSSSAHLSLIWMDSRSRNSTPSTYAAPPSRLTLLSDTCLSFHLSSLDGSECRRPAEGSSRDRSRRTGLAAAQRRRLWKFAIHGRCCAGDDAVAPGHPFEYASTCLCLGPCPHCCRQVWFDNHAWLIPTKVTYTVYLHWQMRVNHLDRDVHPSEITGVGKHLVRFKSRSSCATFSPLPSGKYPGRSAACILRTSSCLNAFCTIIRRSIPTSMPLASADGLLFTILLSS
jgi:hypothetical protein